jgi:hypothetical protein
VAAGDRFAAEADVLATRTGTYPLGANCRAVRLWVLLDQLLVDPTLAAARANTTAQSRAQPRCLAALPARPPPGSA